MHVFRCMRIEMCSLLRSLKEKGFEQPGVVKDVPFHAGGLD